MNNSNIQKFMSIGSLTHTMYKYYNDFIDELNLTVTEAVTLFVLKYGIIKSMVEISRVVGIEKNSFTSVANKLLDKNLINKTLSNEDRRRYILTLTEKGSQTVDKIEVKLDKCLEERMSRFTKEEQVEFIQILDRLCYFEEIFRRGLYD